MNKFSILLMTLPLVGVVGIAKVQAQVTPADDGTGAKSTTVIDNINQIDITGGKTSGTNQFHSLDKFNVNTGQTVNFQAGNENITNILTRVTGGDVSKINGTIKVTDGNNPNLFLMNPAGFIFGNGATLDLPGSLTVTTANSIRLDSRFNLFRATDDVIYSDASGNPRLTENPTAFNFDDDNVGAIINSGNLSVEKGQNITLVGGTVVNTGTLTAEDGQINIAAVPGSNTVQISQTGNLLSFNITEIPENSNELPGLLVGGNLDNVTGISNDGATVTLTGSGISIKDGDAVLSAQDNIEVNGISGGNVSIISENGNIKTGRIESGEKVLLSAEKGNIEVDTIFAGILNGNVDNDEDFRAGDVDIKAGGFFRAIGTEDGQEDAEDSDTSILASITVANPISVPEDGNRDDDPIDETKLPFISIKTKNDEFTQNKPGDGIGEVKIEVGTEFFVIGEETDSLEDNESGTAGDIAARTNPNSSGVQFVDGRTFGSADPPATIINPPGETTTGGSNTGDTNTGGSNTVGTNTGGSNTVGTNTGDSNTAGTNTGDSNTAGTNTDDSNTIVTNTGDQDQRQNQERSETTFFGVLSLDESLVALLEEKGHATELTLSNDEEGELKGSDFNFFNTDDDEELETFNFDRGLSYKNYVFHRK